MALCWVLIKRFDECGRLRHGIGDRKNFVTCISYKNAVLPLGREAVVAGDDGPAISQGTDFFAASVDHGLDGEDHARFQFFTRSGLAIMQNLGVLMEFAPYAVAAVFAHNGKALLFGMLLDDMADVAHGGAGANLLYAQPHALIGGFGEPPGQNGRRSEEHKSALQSLMRN